MYSRPESSSGSAQGKVESGWALERRSRETAGQTDGSGPNVPTKRELRTFFAGEASAGLLRELSDSRADIGRGGSTKVKPTTPGKPTFPTGPGRDVVDKSKNNS